jgi:hypothetical protein
MKYAVKCLRFELFPVYSVGGLETTIPPVSSYHIGMRYANFEVLTAVLPSISISLYVTLRRWVLGCRRYEGAYLFHLQGFSSSFGMSGTAFPTITSKKPGNLVWGTLVKTRREMFVMLHYTSRFVTVGDVRWWLNWKEGIKMLSVKLCVEMLFFTARNWYLMGRGCLQRALDVWGNKLPLSG